MWRVNVFPTFKIIKIKVSLPVTCQPNSQMLATMPPSHEGSAEASQVCFPPGTAKLHIFFSRKGRLPPSPPQPASFKASEAIRFFSSKRPRCWEALCRPCDTLAFRGAWESLGWWAPASIGDLGTWHICWLVMRWIWAVPMRACPNLGETHGNTSEIIHWWPTSMFKHDEFGEVWWIR